MIPLPTSYVNYRPRPLTVLQEAMRASWQVRLDKDGCWMEAWLGLLAALPRNGTCPLGTGACVQHVPVSWVHQTCSCSLLPLFPIACLHVRIFFPVALFHFAHAGAP